MSKHFIKGNEAIAEAAVRAGCRFYAGYPITPQSEVPEILSVRLPEVGGNFIQGESEIASVYMVYGVAATGIRSMTSSSGPGLALKSEGISFLAAGRIPAVIVNVVRGGPAIGTIMPSQQDYFSATKAPAPGGFRCFVLAPQSVQEAADLVYRAFDYADKYRTPVMVLADGMIGNMMESIELPPMRDLKTLPSKEAWRYNKYNDDGSARVLNTYSPTAEAQMDKNIKMAQMYEEWDEKEQLWEEYLLEDAEYVLCAYGSSARIAKSAVKELRQENIKAGLIRPITLVPFAKNAFAKLDYGKIKHIFCPEMSIPPQFAEDVRLQVEGRAKITSICTSGGVILDTDIIVNAVKAKIQESSDDHNL
jgi:2-oxoglutarate ferredoxin oxidoreductase subunit alpha